MSTVEELPPDEREVEAPPSNRSLFPGEEPRDLMIAGYALVLLVAFGPFFFFPTFTPRIVLVLLVLPIGLATLVRQAIEGDVPARWAAALIAWIAATGLLSADPSQYLFGSIGKEFTGLVVTGLLALWAVGRTVTNVRPVVWAVLTGLGFNALVGTLQIALDLERGSLALQFSRATGFTSNPVFLGGLMAGAAALVARLASDARVEDRRWWLAVGLALAWFGAVANFSGSRVGLAAGLIVVIAVSSRATPARWVATPSYVIGVLLAGLLVEALGSRSASSRLADAGGGQGGRWQAWTYGWEAFLDRPIQGWGISRFRAATQARYSGDFVREYALDDTRQAWFDAHNIVVTFAVGLGIVGLVLAGGFAWTLVRRSRGPLTAFALAVALTWMLQPAGLGTAPIAMLVLGTTVPWVPAPPDREERAAPRSWRGVELCCLAIGAATMAWLAVADLRLEAAVDRRDAASIERAAGWFPDDSVIADLVAQAWFVEEETDPSLRPDVVAWSQRAIAAEPDRPYYWTRSAARLIAFERYDEARRQLDEALALQPWHARSIVLLEFWAGIVGDPDAERRASAQLCLLELDECP